PRDLPQLPAGVKIADTHCHLSMIPNVPLALARCAHYNVQFLECIIEPAKDGHDEDEYSAAQVFENLDSWLADAQKILDSFGEGDKSLPTVRFAVGVHPHNSSRFDISQDDMMRYLKDPRTSCIGEIGLDYHYDLSPRDTQRRVFAQQLQMAQKLGLPVALHIREAHAEALEILRDVGVPQAGCILHCFNLDAKVLKPFVELGCYVAFGGPLTFKKSYETRASAVDVPLNKLLTETDAPFMAPEPIRGVLATPDFTLYSLECLLKCFGYFGQDKALTAFMPRPSDMPPGQEPKPIVEPDFNTLQNDYTDTDFCNVVYKNACDLLNRAAKDWQTL
ncbi:MAG: TatD family hydrolase, partial [Coriobacteriales bacterium]|nr:TatD family hydrolase [Coriobacteriales bacterium]